MKKTTVFFALILSIATSAFCVPSSFSVVTFAISNYQYNWQHYSNSSKEVAENFLGSLVDNINSVYPGKVYIESAQYYDAAVTKSVFTGNIPDRYNFVLYKGHGGPDLITMWPNGEYVYNTDKKFGGKTYWVLLRSCTVLRNGMSDQEPWFGGVHSILGYSSLSYTFGKYKKKYDCGPFGLGTCTYSVASYYVERDFGTNWIKGKQEIFEAYYTAVFKWIHKEYGAGVEPKIVYRMGYVDGKFFEPWKEKFETSIQKPVFVNPGSYTSIGSMWVTLGEPEY